MPIYWMLELIQAELEENYCVHVGHLGGKSKQTKATTKKYVR